MTSQATPDSVDPNIAVGIDLGTTNSVCYVKYPNVPLPSPVSTTQEKYTPSVVAFPSENQELVGIDAVNVIESGKPVQYVAMAKLLMGKVCKEVSDKERKQFESLFNVEIDWSEPDAPPRFVIKRSDGTTKKLRPEEIGAKVLKKIHDDVCVTNNIPINSVIPATITVPARFGEQEKVATMHAARLAKIKVVRIIKEPIAATLCAVNRGFLVSPSEEQEPKQIVVFDFGGGTIDVVYLNLCPENVVEMIVPDGDTMLGGRNVTSTIRDRFLEQFCRTNQYDSQVLYKDSNLMGRLWREAEEAKKRIQTPLNTMGESAMETTGNRYEAIIYNLKDGHNFEFVYRYTHFKKDFADTLKRLMEIFDRVLVDASKTVMDIDYLILVGGSCRIQLLHHELKERLKANPNAKIISGLDYDDSIAHGACYLSQLVTKKGITEGEETQNMVLLDVIGLSYCIDVNGGESHKMIKRKTAFPYKYTQTFTTNADNQPSVEICVYEGEYHLSANNKLIGKFTLEGIQRARRGVPKIDVTFKVGVNGVLTVEAQDQQTGVKKDVTIQSSRMSKEDLEKYEQELNEKSAADEKAAQVLRVRNQIQNFCDAVTEAAENISQPVPAVINNTENEMNQIRRNNMPLDIEPADLEKKLEDLKKNSEVVSILTQAQSQGKMPESFGDFGGMPNAPSATGAPPAQQPVVEEAD